MASEIMVRITKPGALLLFHADGRWHLHDATRGGRVLSGGKARYAPSYKFQKQQKYADGGAGKRYWQVFRVEISREIVLFSQLEDPLGRIKQGKQMRPRKHFIYNLYL